MAASPPRGRFRSVLAAFVAASFVAAADAQHAGVTFGPAPEWIVPSPLGESRPYDEVAQTDGLEHLLIDDQIRTGSGPREHYQRHAYRVLDEKGIRDASQIQIEFDPSCETVVIHDVAVYRGESEVSRVDASGVRVVEREQRLEALVYDERKTIIAILGDVRIGDRVESTFTIRGENPVFEGRFAARFTLAWAVPVRRSVIRILTPEGLDGSTRMFLATHEPVVTEEGGWKELRWDRQDVPAVLPQSGTPTWFDPFPRLEFSQYADWADVARWGLRLYERPAEVSAELRAQIEEIAQRHSDPEERILAALAFVRDEVRYLSLALGPHSHRPSLPDTVLARRFGDCKDKTVLLVALLEGLGVRARPAFVDTRTAAHAAESLPSPFVFDHVIVRVEHDGRAFWLDPTRLHARGALDRLTCPRYGVALVLDEATIELVPIEPSFDDRPGMEVRTNIDATLAGRAARMSVETTHTWASADSMRERLGELGRATLEKGYLDFYARSHPTIRSDAPLEIRDDERENVVVTTERYFIPDYWRLSEDGTRLEASIAAPEIAELVSTPSTAVRTMPLGVVHPMNVSCQIAALLPGSWDLERVRRRIETDAVRFGCDIHTTGSVVNLYYDYETLQDSVPPEKALAHVEQLGRILEVTGYDLSTPVDGSAEQPVDEFSDEQQGRHWLFLLGFAGLSFLLCACVSAALFFYRPAPPTVPVEPADAHLHGIRGWLALAAVGMVFTPVYMVVNVIQMVPVFELSTWTAVTSQDSADYHPLWAPVLLVELFAHIAMLNVSIVLLVLFLMKRRAVPRLFIASRIAWIVFLVVDSNVANALPDMPPGLPSQLGGQVCSTLIWVAYFVKSRRVRATFVR